MKALTSWPVPAAMTVLFLVLVWSSEASMAGSLAAMVGLAMVLVMWALFREMSFHAEITRALAIGDAALAHRLIEVQLARRGKGRQAPFLVYRAMAHELAGDWTRCAEDAEAARTGELARGGKASWRLAAACLRVGALCELGRTAEAHTLFEADIRPRAAALGPGGSLPAQLTEGRLLLAAGEPAEAIAKLTPLTRHVRLGPAQRALALHTVGRAEAGRGDDAAAKRAFAQARSLTVAAVFGSDGQAPLPKA